MKAALAIAIGILLIGTLYGFVIYNQSEDPRAVRAFVESRGKSAPPSSIRSEIGKGI